MLASTLGGLPNSPIGGRPPGEAWSDFLDTQSGCTTCCTTYFCLLAGKIMGNRGVKQKPKAPATRLPAKGKPVGPRRTPQHIADPAGLCDTYDVEDIIAERMAKNDKGNSEKHGWSSGRVFLPPPKHGSRLRISVAVRPSSGGSTRSVKQMNGLNSRSAREQEMRRKKSARRSKNQSLGLPY